MFSGRGLKIGFRRLSGLTYSMEAWLLGGTAVVWLALKGMFIGVSASLAGSLSESRG